MSGSVADAKTLVALAAQDSPQRLKAVDAYTEQRAAHHIPQAPTPNLQSTISVTDVVVLFHREDAEETVSGGTVDLANKAERCEHDRGVEASGSSVAHTT